MESVTRYVVTFCDRMTKSGASEVVVFVPHNCFGTPGSVGIRTTYSTGLWQHETSVDGIGGDSEAGAAENMPSLYPPSERPPEYLPWVLNSPSSQASPQAYSHKLYFSTSVPLQIH